MATQLRRHWVAIGLTGAVALTLTQGCLYIGLGYTSFITASIVMAIWPIVAIILAALVLQSLIFRGVSAQRGPARAPGRVSRAE